MPKLILEFNLPEEREEAELAQKAGAYLSAVWDWGQMLRGWDKHGLPAELQKLPPEELITEVRKRWFEILTGNDIDSP